MRNRVRQLRYRHNWSLRELSQASGVAPNTIWRMEKGSDTTLRNALKIASALRLTVQQIWDAPAPGARIVEQPSQASSPKRKTPRELRKEQGWRLYDLSRKSGVSMTTLAMVENGHLPTLGNAMKVASAFGVSIHEIWAFEEKPYH